MKSMRIVILAALLACALVVSAQAASVAQGEMVKVKVNLKNVSNDVATGTLILTAKNKQGAVIGKFTQGIELKDGNKAAIAFDWKAPKYATDVFWTAQVVDAAIGDVVKLDDDDEHDDDHDKDDDDDHDDDHDDSHHDDGDDD